MTPSQEILTLGSSRTTLTKGLLLYLFATFLINHASGHGRVQTAISAQITENAAAVTIRAALVDLIIVGELDYNSVSRLSSEEQALILRPAVRIMVERLRLMNAEDERLVPRSVRWEMPDFALSEPAIPSPDQQHITIVIDYHLSQIPRKLTFWQSFGEARTNDLLPVTYAHSPSDRHDFADNEIPVTPIQAILTIRQNGELVLLPSELGPGFPLSFPFSWDDDFVPLAHRSSLRSATPQWENRPANARLSIDGTNVRWNLFLPLEAIRHALANGESITTCELNLRERLRDHLFLTIDGITHDPGKTLIRVYPMSAMAVQHQRKLAAGENQPGMVVIEFSCQLPEPPREISAGWTFYSETIPRLYSEVVYARSPADFAILSPDSPQIEWSAASPP